MQVQIPEWDPEEKFYLDELRADVCMELVTKVQDAQKMNQLDTKGIEMFAEMLSRSLTNSEGERPTKEWLMKVPFDTLQRVGTQALELNGFSPAKAAEAEKNSQSQAG
jgi:hypothetical protein